MQDRADQERVRDSDDRADVEGVARAQDGDAQRAAEACRLARISSSGISNGGTFMAARWMWAPTPMSGLLIDPVTLPWTSIV
jgi:hypothetical protein